MMAAIWTLIWILIVIVMSVTAIWAFAVLPEYVLDLRAGRMKRRNCPTCRDHYPVCWLEPCRERGHTFGYDCSGLADHIMLCQKHEDQYWHIRQMEKELL